MFGLYAFSTSWLGTVFFLFLIAVALLWVVVRVIKAIAGFAKSTNSGKVSSSSFKEVAICVVVVFAVAGVISFVAPQLAGSSSPNESATSKTYVSQDTDNKVDRAAVMAEDKQKLEGTWSGLGTVEYQKERQEALDETSDGYPIYVLDIGDSRTGDSPGKLTISDSTVTCDGVERGYTSVKRSFYLEPLEDTSNKTYFMLAPGESMSDYPTPYYVLDCEQVDADSEGYSGELVSVTWFAYNNDGLKLCCIERFKTDSEVDIARGIHWDTADYTVVKTTWVKDE